ncbi:MAG TPA: hypothetical protein PKL34_05830 [Candidatus Cloacimonadota bacterium]|nr:hypothetical protein [Candidatus Cloacimonadota bacterium]
MKKSIVILILLGMAICLAGQEFNSFRYLSTGGALDGDVEYAFDPLDLSYLKGIRFFTGLSNYSSEDQLFKDSSENYLLLGGSTDKTFITNLKAALLFKYHDTENPLPFDFYADPYDDIYVSTIGQAEYDWQGYIDTNGNNLYDNYVNYYQKFRNMELDKNSNLSLVLSYPLGENNVLGYKLGYVKDSSENSYCHQDMLYFDYGDPSYEGIYQMEALPDMDPLVNAYDEDSALTGDFKQTTDSSTLRNQLAYSHRGEKWELSGYYSLDLGNLDQDSNNEVLYKEHNSINSSFLRDEASSTHKYASDQMANRLAGRVRYTLVPNEDHAHSGYLAAAISVGMISNDVESRMRDYSNQYSPIALERNIYEDIFDIDGDESGMELGLMSRLNMPLNSSTFFGLGIAYNHMSEKLDGTYDYYTAYLDTTYHAFTGEWVTAQKEISKSSGDVTGENYTHTVRVPVGLEYWFTSNAKWAMRFGSVFSHTTTISKYRYNPTLIEPTLIVEYTPDGIADSWIEDNTSLKENSSTKTSTSDNSFSYGIGYKANKNLQIDLLAMFDTDNAELWNTHFLRSLRLAFSINL